MGGENRNSRIEHMIIYLGQQVYLSRDKDDEEIYNGPNSSLSGFHYRIWNTVDRN